MLAREFVLGREFCLCWEENGTSVAERVEPLLAEEWELSYKESGVRFNRTTLLHNRANGTLFV